MSHDQEPSHWLRKVEFESLPRVVQDRFVAATAEQFPPWPILRAHPRAPASRGWTVVAIASFVCLVVVAASGFGDPFSRFATAPSWSMVVYVGLWAMLLLGFFRALAARGAHDLPFRAGVYLFPSEVVDARSPTLRIHPLAELASIEARGASAVSVGDAHRVHLCFQDGAEFSFEVPDRVAADAAIAQALRARDALDRAHDAPSLVGLVDPLWEPGEEVPVSTSKPFHVRWSFWVERSLSVALAGAVVLGPPAFLLRDRGSDELAFAHAQRDGSSSALAAYALHGKRHVREVQERWLPLTALRALTQTAAIEQWMRAFPVAASTPEAIAAHREALLRDLGALGSIPAIRAFGATHPELDVKDALGRAHRALLARHVDSIANDHLLKTPEACGVQLAIVVSRGDAALRDADMAVMGSKRFAGTSSFPSSHFVSQTAAEDAARATLGKRVTDAFPEGCLRLDPTAKTTLALRWTPRFAGTLKELGAPPAVFVDLTFDLSARLLDEGGKELARLERSYPASVRAAALATFEGLLLREPGDASIEKVGYADMTAYVLQLAARDVGTWFVGSPPELAMR